MREGRAVGKRGCIDGGGRGGGGGRGRGRGG